MTTTQGIPYSAEPDEVIDFNGRQIATFAVQEGDNIDPVTVASFGEEWSKFSEFSADEIIPMGNEYFDVVTEEMLNKNSVALDLGCGTGRWSRYAAGRAGFVEAIDPSQAVLAASALTEDLDNIRITQAGVDNIPFPDDSFDFIFSLGVLHHIPDTTAALTTAVKKLKPGGHCLLYLYYALDNRGPLFKLLFHTSGLFRAIISKLPAGLKKLVCDLIAITVYLPFVLLVRIVKAVFGGKLYEKMPLHYYWDKTWNVIRNDSLDRFGTPLEQRFTKQQISDMMNAAGLTDHKFSDGIPYWHVVGRKK